jgi:SpoU rRNA methylase family enzyme
MRKQQSDSSSNLKHTDIRKPLNHFEANQRALLHNLHQADLNIHQLTQGSALELLLLNTVRSINDALELVTGENSFLGQIKIEPFDELEPEQVTDKVFELVKEGYEPFESEHHENAEQYIEHIKEGIEQGFIETFSLLRADSNTQSEDIENIYRTYDLLEESLHDIENIKA